MYPPLLALLTSVIALVCELVLLEPVETRCSGSVHNGTLKESMPPYDVLCIFAHCLVAVDYDLKVIVA